MQEYTSHNGNILYVIDQLRPKRSNDNERAERYCTMLFDYEWDNWIAGRNNLTAQPYKDL